MPQAKRSNPPVKAPVSPEKLAEAAAYEAEIATSAQIARDDAEKEGSELTLTPGLFMVLYPLLTRPIPEGYLETVSRGDGKPYDSTGIRSVQVQHDRMNNVLTPMWWWETVEYADAGKLCHVTVYVGSQPDLLARNIRALMLREAWGGVERGSTTGNLYKGSYTNAAKMAFARIGVGHEVYIGALDFDPDVSQDAADVQAKPDREKLPPIETITAEQVADLKDKLQAVMPEDEDLQRELWNDFKVLLGGMGVAGVKGWNEGLAKLTPAQAEAVDAWLLERGN